MRSIEGFQLDELPLAGHEDRDPNCRLMAHDVTVAIGREEANPNGLGDEKLKVSCSVTVGSLACASCSLGSYKPLKNVMVGFTIRRTISQSSSGPLAPRIVVQEAQDAASLALPCVRQESSEGRSFTPGPLRVIQGEKD